MVDAAVGIAGSAFAGSAQAVAEITAPVTGDLVRALRELGLGMTTAADRYHWVDAQAAAAYASLATSPPPAAPLTGVPGLATHRAMAQ